MARILRWLWLTAAVVVLGTLPAHAQGKGPKRYAVTTDKAFNVTKEILGKHGYQVVRIEVKGSDRLVYYRRGNMGRGKGKGPVVKMIIRRVENRVVFVDTPDAILVDINVRLRL